MSTFFLNTKNRMRGFTLIELLVVIAIIGVLATIVLASLQTARLKARNARRITDVKQLQLALELYFDANTNSYPTALTSGPALTDIAPTYIPAIPADPSGGAYTYERCSLVLYHLGATLEPEGGAGNPAFSSDLNAAPAGCTGTWGADNAKCSAADVGTGCFDVRP